MVRFAAMSMELQMAESMTIALISEVFHDDNAAGRLRDRLAEAKSGGADIALLPELPLNPWSPATQHAHDEDAELLDGPRTTLQRELAAELGIGLVGGAIHKDPHTGTRHNTALVINSEGNLLGTWRKSHVPEEPGFWETSHYAAGLVVPTPIAGLSMPIGVQICSDINRPEGSHLLGAAGAACIFNPRATELATFDRWKHVFIANALTSACYVVSANRPAPENGVLIGGPSMAVAPNGQVLVETTDPIAIVTIDRKAIEAARIAYPGYLPVRADVYAAGWKAITERNANG